MNRYGFIRTKDELKFLILYVMTYLTEAVSFDDLGDMVMIEEAFSYMEFVDAFEELVGSKHISREKGDKCMMCELTQRGRDTANEFYKSIPSVVREEAKLSALRVIKFRLRENMVDARTVKREDGTATVILACMDGDCPIFKIELMISDSQQGEPLVKNFKQNFEKIYDGMLCVLKNDYSDKGK